jgi:hypothetical protein
LALSHASEHDSAAEKAATAAACKEDELKEAMHSSQLEAERMAKERKREEAELEQALKMSRVAPAAVPLLQVQRREMHACGLLTKPQLAALTYAAQRGGARPFGSAMSASQLLQRRVTSLGFRADDLARASNFLRDEAPLLIHVNSNSLPLLLKDTHYRNGFEIAGDEVSPLALFTQVTSPGSSIPHASCPICELARVTKWMRRIKCSVMRTTAPLPLSTSSMVSERRVQLLSGQG